MIGHKKNRTKGTNNAPIPEDSEQYCFRMPLKLEVHKRYCSTRVWESGEKRAGSGISNVASGGECYLGYRYILISISRFYVVVIIVRTVSRFPLLRSRGFFFC